MKSDNTFLGALKASRAKVEDDGEVTVIREGRRSEPEEILRGANFKIKMVTPTSFGTQIDFAKKYDAEEIEDVLSDFNIKIKDKSVFIIE